MTPYRSEHAAGLIFRTRLSALRVLPAPAVRIKESCHRIVPRARHWQPVPLAVLKPLQRACRQLAHEPASGCIDLVDGVVRKECRA